MNACEKTLVVQRLNDRAGTCRKVIVKIQFGDQPIVVGEGDAEIAIVAQGFQPGKLGAGSVLSLQSLPILTVALSADPCLGATSSS